MDGVVVLGIGDVYGKGKGDKEDGEQCVEIGCADKFIKGDL